MAKREVLIASPYIKTAIATKLWTILRNRNITTVTITRFKETDFNAGASDIDSAWLLSGHAGGGDFICAYNNLLHSKMYIIDREVAYVGSSNLTYSGLVRNREACVRSVYHPFVAHAVDELQALLLSSERLEEAHFVSMIDVMRNSAAPQKRQDEHLYNYAKRVDLFSHSETAVSWLDQPSLTATAARPTNLATTLYGRKFRIQPMTDQTNPSVIVNTADRESPDLLPIDNLSEPEIDEANNCMAPSEGSNEEQQLRWYRQTSKFQQYAKEFLTQIKRRLGLSAKPHTLYPFAIVTASIRGAKSSARYHQDEFDLDPSLYFGRFPSYLRSVGKSTFRISMFVIAQKCGLLDSYGIAAVATMTDAIFRRNMLAGMWDANLLGPVMSFDYSEELDERSYQDALLRLIGAITIEEGVDRASIIVEDFFNPLDILGTDVLSVIDFKDAKTRLQEVAQKVLKRSPVYSDYTQIGPSHAGVWSCQVSVGKIVCTATGPSKSRAETGAAELALTAMDDVPGWRSAKYQAHQEELTRMRRDARHSSNRDLELPSYYPKIDSAYQASGIKISPKYGYLALIDNEARARQKLVCDNRVLAYVGAAILDCAIVQELHSNSTPDGSLGGKLQDYILSLLPKHFDLDGLRRSAVLPPFPSSDRRLDVMQAVVAGVALSSNFDGAIAVLKPAIQAIIGEVQLDAHHSRPDASGARLAHNEWRIEAKRFLEVYDPAVAYTAFVQNVTQGHDRSRPKYLFKQDGPSNAATFHAVALWRGYQGAGTGMTKRSASNEAAYQLLRQLDLAELLEERLEQHGGPPREDTSGVST